MVITLKVTFMPVVSIYYLTTNYFYYIIILIMKQMIFKIFFVLLPALLIGSTLIYGSKLVFGKNGIDRLHFLEARFQDVQKRNKQLSNSNKRLLEKIKNIKSDHSYIEKTARDELGLVKPNELIFQFETE